MKRLGAASPFLLALLSLILTWSCKPSVPSEFIPQDEMEDILYDYHLADAMARMQSSGYDANLLAYRTAVLKKHNVTPAEFDTSMVYYMRHTEQLHTIYEHIAQRMGDKAHEYGSSAGMMGSLNGASASGDTVDIWKGANNIALIPNQPYNSYSFSLMPDSSFHRGDSFVLTMSSDFIFQDGMRDGIAALVLVFKNDSVTSNILHLSSTGQTSVMAEDRDSLGVKEIKGFFLLNKNNQANTSSTTLHLMTLSNIHLFRCHPKPKPVATPQTGAPAPGDSMRRASRRIRMANAPGGMQDTVKSNRPLQ